VTMLVPGTSWLEASTRPVEAENDAPVSCIFVEESSISSQSLPSRTSSKLNDVSRVAAALTGEKLPGVGVMTALGSTKMESGNSLLRGRRLFSENRR
jgi:hypothetical protein